MRVGIDPQTSGRPRAIGRTTASTRPRFRVRRVYDETERDGGCRVLVDRLWPRGVTKSAAALDEWLKEIAPSTALRRWYGHDVQRFDEFARGYRVELGQRPASDEVAHILGLARSRLVTLLTATRDVEHSAAQVLLDHLSKCAVPSDRWRAER